MWKTLRKASKPLQNIDYEFIVKKKHILLTFSTEFSTPASKSVFTLKTCILLILCE